VSLGDRFQISNKRKSLKGFFFVLNVKYSTNDNFLDQ